MKKLRLILLALAALAPASVLAQDSSAGLMTGGLEILRSADLSVDTLDLFISATEIRADYAVRNDKDRPVESVVSFAMPDVVGGYVEYDGPVDGAGGNLFNTLLEQDGKPVETRLSQRAIVGGVDFSSLLTSLDIPLFPYAPDMAEALDRLTPQQKEQLLAYGLVRSEPGDPSNTGTPRLTARWTLQSSLWWTATFPAGKVVRLHQSYAPVPSFTVVPMILEENGLRNERYTQFKQDYCIDDSFLDISRQIEADLNAGKDYLITTSVDYHLTSASSRYQPIGDFHLTVDTGNKGNHVSLCLDGIAETAPGKLEFNAKDFYPERDLKILLLTNLQG